jgi:hypothetical protein
VAAADTYQTAAQHRSWAVGGSVFFQGGVRFISPRVTASLQTLIILPTMPPQAIDDLDHNTEMNFVLPASRPSADQAG